MSERVLLQEFLDGARVGADVFSLRPDYRAVLLAVDGLLPGPSDAASDARVQRDLGAASDPARR